AVGRAGAAVGGRAAQGLEHEREAALPRLGGRDGQALGHLAGEGRGGRVGAAGRPTAGGGGAGDAEEQRCRRRQGPYRAAAQARPSAAVRPRHASTNAKPPSGASGGGTGRLWATWQARAVAAASGPPAAGPPGAEAWETQRNSVAAAVRARTAGHRGSGMAA